MDYIIKIIVEKNKPRNFSSSIFSKIDLGKNYKIIDIITENRKKSNEINTLLGSIEQNQYDSELVIKAIENDKDSRFNKRVTGNRFYSNEIVKPEYFLQKNLYGIEYNELSLELSCSNPLL
jgi:hypothetical protein